MLCDISPISPSFGRHRSKTHPTLQLPNRARPSEHERNPPLKRPEQSAATRITFGDGIDASLEEPCLAWGPSAVWNPGPMGQGCYWDLPDEDGGNTDRMLGAGESFRYTLHPTESDTRWSGTIWASTGCDLVDGCATGVCYSPTTEFVCPAYVGPGGPTTKAEFTLSDGGMDYYDVSAIDGVNLPMEISPDSPYYPQDTSIATILKVRYTRCKCLGVGSREGWGVWVYIVRAICHRECLCELPPLFFPAAEEQGDLSSAEQIIR